MAQSRGVSWWLATMVAVLGFFATIGLLIPIVMIDRELAGGNQIGALVHDAPASTADVEPAYGMVELQLAFTASRASKILDNWTAARRENPLAPRARASITLDWWFIVAYAALLTSLAWLARPYLSRGLGWFATVIVFLPAAAAVFDVIENVGLIRLLGNTSNPPGWLVAVVGMSATLKFVALGLVVIPLTVFVIVAWRWLLRKTLLQDADQGVCEFPAVLADERHYIAARRRQLRIERKQKAKDDAKDGERTIGLAFSGGGIRSATFNLGVLQALSRRGVLPRVDYLSTVSGGGYIGSALSSLLSMNHSKTEATRTGDAEQYHFSRRDRPRFRTEQPTFPFDRHWRPEKPQKGRKEETFTGRVQLEHLRTHGDFLVRHKSIVHRDVLRAVGSVLGGLFFHLLLFGVLLGAMAGVYVFFLDAIAGDLRGAVSSISSYATSLFTQHPAATGRYPFLVAVVIGALVTAGSMLFIERLVWSLPRNWFERTGAQISDEREYRALWALFCVTLLTASLVSAHYISRCGSDPSFIMLPFGVYAGGWLATLALHPIVAIVPGFGRKARSGFAAWKGIYNYLLVIAAVMALFPFFIHQLSAEPDFTIPGVGAWLVSVISAWFFRGKSQEDEGKAPIGVWVRRVMALGGALRKLVLAVAVTAAIVLGVLLLAAVIVRIEPSIGIRPIVFRAIVTSVLALVFLLMGFMLDFNKLSLHYFYRDRLVEAYMQTLAAVGADSKSLDLTRDNAEMPLTCLHGRIGARHTQSRRGWLKALATRSIPSPFLRTPQGKKTDGEAAGRRGTRARSKKARCATSAPYHLLVTCLNLAGSRDMTRRDRKSDYFVFSRLFCGSHTTGYMDTERYRSGETKLARAMTISGAAASSGMGRRTYLAQALVMTVFNIRLGQWTENPGYRKGAEAHRRENQVFWPRYLFKEMLASTDADSRLVYISDGGHTGDNLGICPLLQRRCRLIIASDAECDPELSFGSLTEALRQVYIDDGVKVDIDLDAIRRTARDGEDSRHFAIGRIDYPEKDGYPEEIGFLIVLKSSVNGDEHETIKNYDETHEAFPHETTGDQFFDNAQFEAYRALGEHIVHHTLDELDDAVTDRGAADAKIWDEVVGPLHDP